MAVSACRKEKGCCAQAECEQSDWHYCNYCSHKGEKGCTRLELELNEEINGYFQENSEKFMWEARVGRIRELKPDGID